MKQNRKINHYRKGRWTNFLLSNKKIFSNRADIYVDSPKQKYFLFGQNLNLEQ